MFFILYWICFAFILIYALSPKRSSGERWFSLGILMVSLIMDFTIGWGWLLVMFWGALCWAGSRAGDN